MEIAKLHPWPQDYVAAVKLQRSLAARVSLRAIAGSTYRLVAGADVSSVRAQGKLWAAVVVLRFPELEIVEEAFAASETEFPYIPGLLSYREVPALLAAFRKLKSTPDIVICDGQGLAHPRFFGLACHLGLWLNLPTIGCAKSRLVGDALEPGANAGDWQPLRYESRQVGAVLRTKARCKPVFVSPGNYMDTSTACQVVLSCCQKARLPEPTRLAHLAVNRYRLNDGAADRERPSIEAT